MCNSGAEEAQLTVVSKDVLIWPSAEIIISGYATCCCFIVANFKTERIERESRGLQHLTLMLIKSFKF